MVFTSEVKNIYRMKFHPALILVLLLFSQFPVFHGCHDEERIALLNFKSFLTDPSDLLSSWHGQNCCYWHGIRCSNSSHVVTVNLRNPNPDAFIRNVNSVLISSSIKPTALNGTISPSLFTLIHLQYLDLSFNNFQFSDIPPQLSNLKSLTYLNLSNSMFSGSIKTQFSNLSLLQYLDISCSLSILDLSSVSYDFSSSKGSMKTTRSYFSSSHIYSTNLSWLRGLANLRVLVLKGIDLSIASTLLNWAVPISLLNNLRLLRLSDCNISSPVPINEFRNLSHLSHLLMDSNFVNSPIPIQLTNFTSLSILDFTNCHLRGSISYLPQLQQFFVSVNPDLMVDLPWMFGHSWPNLQALAIQSTNVVGSIPLSFSNASSLVYFVGSSCSIQGSLPSSIANLSQLELLDLSFNNIKGYLPSSISNLEKLQFLSLFQNNIEGIIPESICQISTLRLLHLGSNNFSGKVPGCFGNLVNLEALYVTGNSLDGNVSLTSMFRQSNPVTIGLGLSGLTVEIDQYPFPPNFQPETLVLPSSNLKGSIIFYFCSLTQLALLDLSSNNLSGSIPSCVFKLPNLSYLDLSDNNLQGTLPPSVHLNPNYFLPTLILANNHLEGPLPLPPKNVEILDYSKNKFSGAIPREIGGRLSNVQYLSFSANNLSGTIPTSICLPGHVLKSLDLSYNHLSGSIPTKLKHCTSLISLNLASNNLSGEVPNILESAKYLKALQLNDNYFHGIFPSFIRGLHNLHILNIGNNYFEGHIPSFIGELQNLQILVLWSNEFNGSIPKEITHLRKLQFLDLSNNKLTGPVPDRIASLEMLTSRPNNRILLGYEISLMYAGIQLQMTAKRMPRELDLVFTYDSGIDLSHNLLDGNIPQEVGLLKGLFMLNLSYNRFSGKIPRSIGNMIGLESLDLSFNNLTGDIPQSLTWIDFLQHFNLSYNNLTGRIPRGDHFDTLSWDGSAYIGNSFLCGFPLNKSCQIDVSSTDDSLSEEDEDSQTHKWFFFGVIALGFGVGFGGLFLALFLLKKKWWSQYWRFFDSLALRIIKIGKPISR